LRIKYVLATATAGMALAVALAGCSATTAGTTTGSSAAAAGGSSSAAPANDWYVTQYGTFAASTQSGSGATVIALPAGAKAGLITAQYTGGANFIVTPLDSTNQPIGELGINVIGAYSGTVPFGLNAIGNAPTQLQVQSSGPWTIAIAPLDSAPAQPASGTGDAVFKYDGAATAKTFTNTGSANFIVNQYSASAFPGIDINEIGNYSGKVPVLAGPSIITLMSNGNWTIG
jgi:hypothetical protein